MTERELKRLSRAELLELLLIQTRETEKLRVQLEHAQQKLRDRQIAVEKSGDLAQAVLAVNGVMESANAAAQQYLHNIESLEKEAREKSKQILEQAHREAEKIRNGARLEKMKEQLVHTSAKPKLVKVERLDDEKTLDEHLQEAMQLLGEC